MRVRQRVTVGQGYGIEVVSFTGGDEISVVIIKLLLADTLIYKETMTSYGKKTLHCLCPGCQMTGEQSNPSPHSQLFCSDKACQITYLKTSGVLFHLSKNFERCAFEYIYL